MARLFQSGFEMNSTSSGVEFTTLDPFAASIVTSPVRSGTYAYRVNPTATASESTITYRAVAVQEDIYVRAYIRIASYPTSLNSIYYNIALSTSAGVRKVALRLTTTGTLILRNFEDSTDLGTSSALSLDTWYRIELRLDTTTLASSVVDARIDGVSFASGTINLAAAVNRLDFGSVNISNTTDLYFDDIAINDSSGSFQNSYPGEGKIILLTPNAAGDNSQWDGDDGTVDPGSPYLYIDEVSPPNDATSFLRSRTTNDITDVNVTSSGIGSSDTVNVVAVGMRANRSAGTTSSSMVTRIKKTSGGTVSEGSSETASTTTWRTNDLDTGNAAPFTLVTYQDPDASNWTQTTLDSMQVGIRCNSGSGDRYVQVTSLWASVEYVPVSGVTTTQTQTGKSNIQATTTRTTTGKSRITKTVSATQTGVARITIATTKTQTGSARITATATKTNTGVSRITAVATKTQTGLGRITITTTKTQTGVSRIQKSTTQTQTGKSRITTLVAQTTTGKARITLITTKTQTGVGRITNTATRTQTGKSDITVATTQTQVGKSAVSLSTIKTQTGTSRITASTSQTQSGKADILKSAISTQTGVARIALVTAKTTTGTSRITASTTKTTTGIADIKTTTTHTITGTANIVGAFTTQTITGKSRISSIIQKLQTGTSRIQKAVTQTQSGKSRIGLITTKTITGKATLTGLGTQNISGRADILATVVRTQPGRARVLMGYDLGADRNAGILNAFNPVGGNFTSVDEDTLGGYNPVDSV